MPSLTESLAFFRPELCLTATGLASLVLGAWPERRRLCTAIAGIGLLAAALALWRLRELPPLHNGGLTLFDASLRLDALALFAKWLVLGVLGLTYAMSLGAHELAHVEQGEYHGLLLIAGVGLMMLAGANNLLMAVLAMETASLCSYLLVGYQHGARASEAALKYFLFGALASGCMLYGIAWLYGLSRTLNLDELLRGLAAHNAPGTELALTIAIVLLLVGLGFKISMVPFHLWTPDAYEGAPTPVAAFLSVGPKVAGLVLLLRIFTTSLADVVPIWTGLLMMLTVATMTFGNLVALAQTNIKRLLAYSTIAQVGYLLIGFVVPGAAGQEGLLLYLAAYLMMNLGAFACVVAITNLIRSEAIADYRGLAQRAPVLAAFLAVFLLSLAGLPPLVGFIGKFVLFGAAIATHHLVLAIAGVVNSAIALYYYVFIIRQMYLEPPAAPVPSVQSWWAVPRPLRLALLTTAAGTLVVGLLPGALMMWVGSSILR